MNTDATYATLAELRNRLGQLADALEPGTPRRWGQRDLTPAEREKLDYHAMHDRAAKEWGTKRGLVAVGETRAPVRIDVLEAIVHVETGVYEVERCVCEWLGITPLVEVTTAERITRVIGLLDRVAQLDDLAAWVDVEAARLARVARAAVGDTEPVHRLDGRCPVCDAKSLRAFPEREQVVCVNEACRCSDEGCRCHADPPRRHRWLYEEWGWLAQILADDLEEAG